MGWFSDIGKSTHLSDVSNRIIDIGKSQHFPILGDHFHLPIWVTSLILFNNIANLSKFRNLYCPLYIHVQTWTKVLGHSFLAPKRMCNLIWNSLIMYYDIQQSPKCFYFLTWPVYAVVLCISGPFRDVTCGLWKIKFGRGKNGNFILVTRANSE